MLAVFSTMPYEPTMNKEKRVSTARTALLHWHAIHGRHDLPWREEITPYAVLVSEFMLQQTTVVTVKPRFAEWLRLFPTLEDLAGAKESEVLAVWQGLGYYSRARRLHTAAKVIQREHGGVIPIEEKALLALPGIGAYTAAAIRAFAFNQHALVLDTNILRVLARWANVTTPIDKMEGKKVLQQIAKTFYPDKECRAVATALMDLGATLCTAGTPHCTRCPLLATCQATDPALLPRKAPRAVTLKRSEHRVWFYYNNQLYLEQSQGPHWLGLWILPELGTTRAQGRPLAEIIYPITRYRVTMTICQTTQKPPAHLQGFTKGELESIPIPSPHRRAIKIALGKL
jgi:A/G-specific adenine glycosylase